MKKFYCKILPDEFIATNIGETVPLMAEHNIYGKKLGNVTIVSENYAIIESDDLSVGNKLSAGSFVSRKIEHYVREVSLVANPRFNDCQVIRVYNEEDEL